MLVLTLADQIFDPGERCMQIFRFLLGVGATWLTACVPPTVPLGVPPTPGASAADANAPRLLLAGGTVMTAAGQVYPTGYIILQAGRIVAVGASADGQPPAALLQQGGSGSLEMVDARGTFITPGLIDVHSHMGVYALPHLPAHDDVNEASRATTAEIRAEDAFWPQDPALSRAVAEGGITTVQILPGSANLIGGRSFVAKLRGATDARALRFPGAPSGLKLACGENPKAIHGGRGNAPMTRMGNIAELRHALLEAEQYARRWQRYTDALAVSTQRTDDPEMPDRDLALETLVALRRGEVLAHIHCYRADEIKLMLDLAREFNFKIRAIHHGLEAYKVRHELAQAHVGVASWADWWGFKLEAWDGVPQNVAMLSAVGVPTAIHSDSESDGWHLNQEAAKAQAAGAQVGLHIDDDQALRWVSLEAAWILGIDQQTGSLEVGKMADIVIWDAHPFSVYARPLQVFSDGVPIYRRGAPAISLQSDFLLPPAAL